MEGNSLPSQARRADTSSAGSDNRDNHRMWFESNAIFSPSPRFGNAVKHFKQRKHGLRFNSRVGEVRILASHVYRHGLLIFVALSGSGLSRPDTALVF